MRYLFSGLLLILSVQSFAYKPKEGNISAVLGPFVSRTNFKPIEQQPKAPYLGGGGLIVQGDLSDHSALEIAMFQIDKVFYRYENGDFASEQTELVHITLGYRKWFTPYLSASCAIFSSYTAGSVIEVDKRIAAGHELLTSARDITEYGLDFSIEAEVWSSGRYAAIIDARYSIDLTRKPNEKADHYGALIGIKYFIQEKQIREKPKDSI